MAEYQSIIVEHDGPIARITLNRPDRLNSFTAAMHEELKEALNEIAEARVIVLTGAGRGFCAGQDLNDRAVTSGDHPVDLGMTVETAWNPLDPQDHQPAAACHRASERRRRGRWREHRARLRHGRGGAVGQVHPELLCHRPHPRQRRHLGASAPRRPGAGDGPCAHRRAALRRESGGMGPHLEMRRRRSARRGSGRDRAEAGFASAARPRRDQGDDPRRAGATRWTRSSTISATRCAGSAFRKTIAKASRRSSRRGSRISSAADPSGTDALASASRVRLRQSLGHAVPPHGLACLPADRSLRLSPR